MGQGAALGGGHGSTRPYLSPMTIDEFATAEEGWWSVVLSICVICGLHRRVRHGNESLTFGMEHAQELSQGWLSALE